MKKWPRLAESEEFTISEGHVSCNEQCEYCYIDKLYDDAVDTASMLYEQYTICAALLIYAHFFHHYTGNGTVLADGRVTESKCETCSSTNFDRCFSDSGYWRCSQKNNYAFYDISPNYHGFEGTEETQ